MHYTSYKRILHQGLIESATLEEPLITWNLNISLALLTSPVFQKNLDQNVIFRHSIFSRLTKRKISYSF